MIDYSLQTLIEIVREAAAQGRPLCIRGGGSKDFLGGPPIGEVLDTRGLRGIVAYEPSELVVTVRGGTSLTTLEAVLAERGQCLPFEPPRFGLERAVTTVSGMVAAGLAGPARAVVGGVRDYVLGATLLNGRGELLSFGGQVMKNVAGYDISRILAGSMGTLGVICEVSLKVLPIAPASVTLRFDMDQLRALRLLNEWAGLPLPISASAWWGGVLVLRLRGAHAAVAAAQRQLGGEVVPENLAHSFWEGLRDHRDEFFQSARRAQASGGALWRLSVAPTAPRLNLVGEQLIEWGGAQRWIITSALPAILHEAASSARGHAALFDNGGRPELSAQAAAPLSPVQLRIQREVKRAFDPQHIFNRQRLHPSL